jgi:hypothetical protein
MSDEDRLQAVRALAIRQQMLAMELQTRGAALRASARIQALSKALRERNERQQADAMAFHPDVIELDMAHAAWFPDED